MGRTKHGSGGSERARRANGEAPERQRGRWSSRRKVEAVLRLLRGEDLDTLSRELRVTAGRLSQWREEFLAGGETALKSRQPSVAEHENQRLLAKIGELSMDNELLRERSRAAEARVPLAQRRSRR